MSLTYITSDLPGVGGAIKTVPEDFVVEEIPAYEACGEGTHLFLLVEKRGITTQEMVRRVARELGIPPTAVGTAGQKDRQSVARQVISVPVDDDPLRASNIQADGIEVIWARRHTNKLRTGHVRGNRFTVRIRGVVDAAEERARAILGRLVDTWLPNFYGAQRFGRQGDNAQAGLALLRGERHEKDRFRRRLFVSALQSAMFNRFLEQRISDGLLQWVVEGDVLQRTRTGGLFVCTPQDLVYAQARFEQREIVPTGPIFGHKMMAPTEGSAAAAREQQALDEAGVQLSMLARFGKLASGTRRPLLVRIEDAAVRRDDDALEVSFALPSGAYATVLLDELMKCGAPAETDG